jgi:hypothetical protein
MTRRETPILTWVVSAVAPLLLRLLKSDMQNFVFHLTMEIRPAHEAKLSVELAANT